MISRVSVQNFKNFSSEEIVELCDPSDQYYFDVVIGRCLRIDLFNWIFLILFNI